MTQFEGRSYYLDVAKLYIVLRSSPLPTDTFIKSNVFKKLVLDKTSEKLIHKYVVAKRGEGQTYLNSAPLVHKFLFPVEMK